MTEVDAVMLEGSAPLLATPQQITSAAESSSMNDQTGTKEKVTNDATKNPINPDLKSNDDADDLKKITETTANSTTKATTTTNAPQKPAQKTTAASNCTSDAEKKVVKSIADKSQTPIDVDADEDDDDEDDDDDDDGGGDVHGDDDCGGAVTTTTNEKDCENDSQVTSSSADITDKHNEALKQESGEANLTPPPQPPSDSAAENSNSQIVDGNDFDGETGHVGEGDDGDDNANGEAETKDEKDFKAKSATDKIDDIRTTASATNNICENSQSVDSINEVESDKSAIIKGRKDNISEIDDDDDNDDAEKEEEKENSSNSEKHQKKHQDQKDNQNNSIVKKSGETDVLSESHIPASPKEISKVKASKEPSNASPANLVERMDVDDSEVDPLCVDNDLLTANSYESKNGVSKNSPTNNGNIVDLDDDSDEDENCDQGDTNNKKVEQPNGGNARKSMSIVSHKEKSACSDSDGAVVIGSDSENENDNENVVNSVVKKQQEIPKPQPPHISDDDDDDCVVIEDDSPVEMTPKSDQGRRKSIVLDSENNSDDSQPPSKRQRRIGVNQLAIKDARSLLITDATSLAGNGKKPPSLNDVGVYPINITTAGGNVLTSSGPPKLAPIGGGIGIAGTSSVTNYGGLSSGTIVGTMPGLVGVNANANLLPGLTDDMFVLEAPSFIVPYIYEKPPGDSLRDIVKEIEVKYELSKDDLTDADKPDEFDMMTEQNKEDRDPQPSQSGKKKKKRRYAPDADDSWSEESEEDDDEDEDDDSESGVRTKVLIKEATDDLTALKSAIKTAAAVTQSLAPSTTAAPAKPGQENYFESPLGKFFMDIGVGLVQEFVQTDLIRLQKRKMRKSLGKNMGDFERAIAALSGNLEASKKKNAAFKFNTKRCEFCNFKSESSLAMAHHYDTPHMNGPLYKCNFCTFEIRNATEIVYHMEAMHNIKARLIKPLPYHQCPNCGFEDNGKAKLARHQPVCAKKFRPELNLAPPNDWEAPAKIPRIKPRHGLVGTATAYQAMAAQAAAQKAALATIQQQQQQARNIQAAALAAQSAVNKIRGRPPVLTKVGVTIGPNGTATGLRGANPIGQRPMATNVVLPNNYQLPGNQLIPTTNAMHTGKKTTMPGQPSISITPLPRQSAAPQTTASPSTSKTAPAGIKPGRSPAGGNKAQFVICEICDGYIKDLEQLRNHMQWMHEVKIHPKMIYNRPPLNCQKCQFRFFTDQGLERHLLGSHGLVTSSMQEAANKGKDAGRCPVCGRMYQWKLLNHVARDHHMTLKPAHLSYKCTVCTATFGMYKQFETHVYTAHSTVAKKAMDSKKNNATAASGTGANSAGNAGYGASSSSSGLGQRGNSNLSSAASNDALLKPLKINDEITIIPQPASKPRITNMESHVID